MKVKRVLFYSHQADLAGAPLSLALLAAGLPKGYEAFFVTPEKGPVLELVKGRVKVLGRLFQIWKLVRFIRANKIDIVHANTVLAQPAAYAAKLAGVKLVWHIREDMQMFPRKLPGKIMELADKVIIISESMREFFPNKRKVLMIYNGLPEAKVKLKAPNTDPVLLYAGSLEKRKGALVLLQALELLKGRGEKFRAKLYGQPLPGQHAYYNKLRKFVRRNGLEKNVDFCGVTNKLSEAIAAADIVTIPSLAEPFGRVAVEAMALKKPVIASKCGGLAEIVADGRTGLLVGPGRAGELLAAILKLIQEPKLARQMGQKGYLRFQRLFTLKKHVQAVLQVYRSLK